MDKTDISNIDCTMFDNSDLLNFVLQRSEILFDIPKSGRVIKSWSKGDSTTLEAIVTEKGVQLATRTIDVISKEFNELRTVLDPISPKSIADIGCGYAIFDLFAAKAYQSKILLIDIEKNDSRHFGFMEEGSAYTSLAKAEQFLIANGLDLKSVNTLNPETGNIMEIKPVDLVVSFLACGFHFPVDIYMPFFKKMINPGGHILLDIRQSTFAEQSKTLSELGEVSIISKTKKSRRVLVTLKH